MGMKIYLTVFALLSAALAVTPSGEKPIDLTGADANKFRSQVGHTVILRGRLEDGKQGPCLWGATPDNVVFYVIPGYAYPKAWTRLMHQQVRLTGELGFRSFDHSKTQDKAGRAVQVPPDYFYMVLELTKIERVESK